MSRIPVPSLQLLRAFSPSPHPSYVACQARCSSNFMPRHKFAKVTRLDKLHRQEKAQMRREKEESDTRAALLEQTLRDTAEQIPSSALPFHIRRTSSSNLPVYESTKAGGSKKITTIRLLSGDLKEMQRDLRTVLQLPEIVIDSKGRKKEPVAINDLTQHVVIAGWRGSEVKKWAEVRGFWNATIFDASQPWDQQAVTLIQPWQKLDVNRLMENSLKRRNHGRTFLLRTSLRTRNLQLSDRISAKSASSYFGALLCWPHARADGKSALDLFSRSGRSSTKVHLRKCG